MSEIESYQIVLDPVAEELQQAVALFLSGCFSLPPASTRRIAASAPIAILSDLDGFQAETVLTELEASLPDGASIRVVKEGDDQNASSLAWPKPPQIFGRPLDDFKLSVSEDEVPCPCCGKMLKITKGPDGGIILKHPKEKKTSNNTVMIPNPDSEDADKDPLFSGFKPLSSDSVGFAAFKSLKAGDTGFWGETRSHLVPEPYEPPPEPEKKPSAKGSNPTGKTTTGLAAYMKPGVFAVILSRSKDPFVVQKVAETMGISEAEAREKCLQLSLCVARDISLDDAKTLGGTLKSLGGRVRIAKPM